MTQSQALRDIDAAFEGMLDDVNAMVEPHGASASDDIAALDELGDLPPVPQAPVEANTNANSNASGDEVVNDSSVAQQTGGATRSAATPSSSSSPRAVPAVAAAPRISPREVAPREAPKSTTYGQFPTMLNISCVCVCACACVCVSPLVVFSRSSHRPPPPLFFFFFFLCEEGWLAAWLRPRVRCRRDRRPTTLPLSCQSTACATSRRAATPSERVSLFSCSLCCVC